VTRTLLPEEEFIGITSGLLFRAGRR